MSYIKILKNIHERLGDYRDWEFTECDLDSLVLALESINENLHDNSSDEEFKLVRDCEGKAGEAERYLVDVKTEEEREQSLDEIRYESAKHLT